MRPPNQIQQSVYIVAIYMKANILQETVGSFVIISNAERESESHLELG